MTEERRKKLQKVLDKRQNNLTVVLENVEDPHNISAVLRTCDAVGIQDVYVLTTQIPRHKKFGMEIGHRSSSSAAKWLTIHNYDDLEKCVQDIKKSFNKIFTTAFAQNSMDLYEIDFTQSIALVFGNEHSGVSEEMTKFSDGNFIIPQMGIIQSLNISVACAITIYEAFRQKRNKGHYDTPSFPLSKVTILKEKWGIIE